MITEQKIIEIMKNQRGFFNSSATSSYEFRVKALKDLKEGIEKFEDKISSALMADLSKCEFESYGSEIGFVLHDLKETLSNLKKWMKPKKCRTPLLNQPGSSKIIYSPLGVNLIISPFNYPIMLTFAPMIAALAAGNTCVIKTSELTPSVSAVIKELIEEVFDPQLVAYIPGEIPETTLLLQQKFDHIFFTGSVPVGSIVMTAAAKHLTPVTLELGGKSPTIVHSDAKLDIAVNRIVYGKFLNAGQSCIAPDYILVQRSIEKEFIEKVKERIIYCYGENPEESKDFGRIVSERHHERLVGLIDQDKVVIGGEYNKENKYLAPTVMRDVSIHDKVMEDEIFGPILPILSYEKLDEVYDIISKMPHHPLAFYVFSESKNIQEELINHVQFGGGCINHCMQHILNQNLPFGGVGDSGMGAYHGIHGFERFSHQKPVLSNATWIDPSFIYPPYKGKLKILKKILK